MDVGGWSMFCNPSALGEEECLALLTHRLSRLPAGSGATILQKAEIRIINQTQCNSLLANQMTPRMMCVGILTGGIDACQVLQQGQGQS